MSKFLKDSEEKMQDVKKHQEFKGKSSKKAEFFNNIKFI